MPFRIPRVFLHRRGGKCTNMNQIFSKIGKFESRNNFFVFQWRFYLFLVKFPPLSCKKFKQGAKVRWKKKFKTGKKLNPIKYWLTIFSWPTPFSCRRRSDLIIKSAAWNDSGKYECRAKNKLTLKRPVSRTTWLDVLSKNSPSTERTSKLFTKLPIFIKIVIIKTFFFSLFQSKTIERGHEGVPSRRTVVLSQRRQVSVHRAAEGAVLRVSLCVFSCGLLSERSTLPKTNFPRRARGKTDRWVMWILRWSINNEQRFFFLFVKGKK